MEGLWVRPMGLGPMGPARPMGPAHGPAHGPCPWAPPMFPAPGQIAEVNTKSELTIYIYILMCVADVLIHNTSLCFCKCVN